MHFLTQYDWIQSKCLEVGFQKDGATEGENWVPGPQEIAVQLVSGLSLLRDKQALADSSHQHLVFLELPSVKVSDDGHLYFLRKMELFSIPFG